MLEPPETVLGIANTLLGAGHESWFVGGAIRDALLGHPNLDWDIATAATPAQVQRLFRRTVPVGVEFGTVGVLDDVGVMHEVTTFRRDVQTDGRHAVVEFGASLEDDLARRDFTINAIACSPVTRELRDPFDGRGDLGRKLLRAVGSPHERMREDRLRALRAFRFAGRFQLTIEEQTWSAILESAPHLGRLSMERVQQEIEKTITQVERPGHAFQLWRGSGAFTTLVPPLATVSDAALSAIDLIPRASSAEDANRTVNRLTALMLDMPHAVARRTLRELRFSNDRVRWVGDMVERWNDLNEAIDNTLTQSDEVEDVVLRRWLSRLGRTMYSDFFEIFAARARALDALRSEPSPFRTSLASVRERVAALVYSDPLEVADLAVNGADLIQAGIKAGPQLGSILRQLLEWVLDDPARNTHDQLLARARELAGGQL